MVFFDHCCSSRRRYTGRDYTHLSVVDYSIIRSTCSGTQDHNRTEIRGASGFHRRKRPVSANLHLQPYEPRGSL